MRVDDGDVYPNRRTVIVIDDDLGFVFWLGHLLDEFGFAAFPARTIRDAEELRHELRLEPDLIIVNAALPGTAEFISQLRLEGGRFKVVAVAQHIDQPVAPEIGAVAVRAKPSGRDEAAKLQWLRLVQGLLSTETNSAPT